MTPDLLFSISSALVLPGWLLLLFAPRWRWTTTLVTTVVLPVLLAVAYGAALLPHLFDSPGGFGSLDEVALLFENRWLLLAGWVHYLIFDLLVGSWIVRDAHAQGVHHGLVIPCLLGTFMVGPLGWLLYTILRGVRKKRWTREPVSIA